MYRDHDPYVLIEEQPWELLGMNWWQWLLLSLVVLMLLILVIKTFIIARQQTAVIIERLGKLHAVKRAGLRMKIPFVDRIVDRMELWLLQIAIEVDTKTKDNVFLKLTLDIQYRVSGQSDEEIADAYYKLDDEKRQIASFVQNAVRGLLPGKDLDEAFADVDGIAAEVQGQLAQRMQQYGYLIEAVLISRIEPDAKVVEAMNDINAALRARVAATERGEAERILAVKRGEGVGGEREAIIASYARSVQMLAAAAGVDGAEASKLLALTMHYDAIRAAADGQATTILLPTDGGSAVERIMTGMVAGNKATDTAS